MKKVSERLREIADEIEIQEKAGECVAMETTHKPNLIYIGGTTDYPEYETDGTKVRKIKIMTRKHSKE